MYPVKRRRSEPTVWMQCCGWHAVHAGFGNVFDDYRDIEFPHPHRLIIRGTNKSAVFVHKSDRVHRAKMLVILLDNLPAVDIKLVNFLVCTASKENILLVRIRVEAHAIWNFAIGRKTRDALARFRVPKLDRFIIARRQESGAIIIKCDIPNALGVPNKGTKAPSLMVAVPKLNFAIHAATKQHVPTVWEESYCIDTFRMARPETPTRVRHKSAARAMSSHHV